MTLSTVSYVVKKTIERFHANMVSPLSAMRAALWVIKPNIVLCMGIRNSAKKGRRMFLITEAVLMF